MTQAQSISNPTATTDLVIVMGVAGSGKSTLAERLAADYGFQYLDGDDFHSDAARALMASGTPLTDAHREPWVAAIKQRLEANAQQQIHTVLAFSGLKQKHRNTLRSAGLRTLVLYLNGQQATIQERINKRQGHFMAPTLLASQFASMENPLGEADVQLIDVAQGFDQVLLCAQEAINRTLHSHDTGVSTTPA
jgi:gluconokinase